MFISLVTELEAKTVRGFDKKEPSYYVRLGSLSTKLRKRAYTRAIAKIQDGKQRSKEFITELQSTIDLVGVLFMNNILVAPYKKLAKYLLKVCPTVADKKHNVPFTVFFSRLNTAGRTLKGPTS